MNRYQSLIKKIELIDPIPTKQQALIRKEIAADLSNLFFHFKEQGMDEYKAIYKILSIILRDK